ncbi:MAG TPA: HipA N-terminal domain-containing protein [Thermoguttaceae bacterium]|nr:HipA N-terminal domain-containing protein [Thermoguttaceae bacterium]
MKKRIGRVCLAGKPVGTIEEVDGNTRFTYLAEWLNRPDAVPVSLTLPLRDEPYLSKGLHPFFENLLPEGWLLEVSTKTLKISKSDPFGLLLATCGDCAGAVEVIRIESADS